jgi:hypothetical protein
VAIHRNWSNFAPATTKRVFFMKQFLSLLLGLCCFAVVNAQVTSGSLSGLVKGSDGNFLNGASVTAIHEPSGSKYVSVANKKGTYSFPSVKIGGPYTITVSYVGFKPASETEIYVSLGVPSNHDFTLTSESRTQTEVVVTSTGRRGVINAKRTGASATLGREAINRTPTIGRTINDITKYNAYSNGRSFGGQDSRLNNFTIDGSVFNNGFGLGSQAQAGGRTNSSAISLDALDELQINIAPYDIRQSGFAGAGINAVTRSGTNQFSGSVYHFWNNNDLVGKKADTAKVPVTAFQNRTYGFRFGGPIIKNKLFFFANAEFITGVRPALDWVANQPGASGNVSRTTAADLLDLQSFLKTNLNYDLGKIDNYNLNSKSNKFIARIDYNINQVHKLTVRYSHHDSESDQIISQSNSSNTAGNGNRTNSALAISGENTGYTIQDNTRSIVAELNSNFRGGFSNQFLVTYNKQIEDRGYKTPGLFPTVDILQSGSTYTSIGMDPFTPNNRLNYSTFNVSNNLSFTRGKHSFVAGVAFESFKSNNLFFYASNGVWVFNSIADFKTAVLAYKANPNLTTSPVAINRFNYRYTLLPNGQLPWQTFKTNTQSLYFQDEFKATSNLRITGGIRFDYVNVPNTARDYFNPVVAAFTFKDRDGKDTKVNTGTTPDSRLYLSPRLGFNWDVKGKKTTQVRGGTGIFLSRIPYVLISNQLGNNGVNIGLINNTGTAALNNPFTLDPTRYTPASTDINALSGYNINASAQDLKFPQVWRTNLAIDQKLPWEGIVATAEFIYNKNINALNYEDVNLKAPTTTFAAGSDRRSTYPALGLSGSAASNARFINPKVGNVFVLTNNNTGYSYSLTTKLEKPITKSWGGMLGYTFAKARDLSSVGSTVNANIPSTLGVNLIEEGFSDNDLRHRIVANVSYRLNYGKRIGGATTFTLGMVSASGSKLSYIFSNDMNGDGQINDLIYIPNNANELAFAPLTVGSTTYTPAQQEAAFNEYINNNEYLRGRKGKYAERNGVSFPWLTQMDFAVEQDFTVKTGKKATNNTLRFRVDIQNFGNLLNKSWGVGNVTTTATPLTYAGLNASGQPTMRLATQVINGQTGLLRDTFVKSRTVNDVYQVQLSIRYIFNN